MKKKKQPRPQSAPLTAAEASGPVKVGDVVIRQPVSFSNTSESKMANWVKGTVVYVHPKGRFHVVKFESGVRESFSGVSR